MIKKDIYKAIADLAELFPFGHLRASVDPAEFLNGVAEEIKELREKKEIHKRLAQKYMRKYQEAVE